MVLAYCFSTHRGWIWEKMAVHSTLGSLASRDLSAHIQTVHCQEFTCPQSSQKLRMWNIGGASIYVHNAKMYANMPSLCSSAQRQEA